MKKIKTYNPSNVIMVLFGLIMLFFSGYYIGKNSNTSALTYEFHLGSRVAFVKSSFYYGCVGTVYGIYKRYDRTFEYKVSAISCKNGVTPLMDFADPSELVNHEY